MFSRGNPVASFVFYFILDICFSYYLHVRISLLTCHCVHKNEKRSKEVTWLNLL